MNNLLYNYSYMDQSPWERSLSSIQAVFTQVEESLSARTQRFNPFRNLFGELFKACDKFATTLITIADTCDQDLLTYKVTDSQQLLSSSYLVLKSGLVGIAQTWRSIAARSKNEIMEPLKVFNDNYKKVGLQSVGRLKQSFGLCISADQQILRNRENYYQCCEKLEKHKQSQAKIMMRIENGEAGQLQRFNKTTKALLERVSNSQKRYTESVEKANQETNRLKVQMKQQALAIRNNETARVQFLKKIASNQFKLLELGRQLNLNYKNETSQAKLEGKGRADLSQALDKMEYQSKGNVTENFISHEELVKSKKNKEFQQQNPQLMELFTKIKQNDKKSLSQFVQGCLQIQPACKLISIQRGQRGENKMVFPPQWQGFKQKIQSLQHYLLYFAFLLNRELNQVSNYYFKLSPPFFNHLRITLLGLLDRLQLSADGAVGDMAIATTYKILKLAQRVVERRRQRHVGGNMKVMIEGLGACKKFRQQRTLKKILKHLIKKGQKKKNESKGMMSFTKGFFSTLTGKRQQSIASQEQQFNALVQLTHLMANLSLPSQVVLPFLKNILKNNGQTSYQYLKDIVQGRRDRQERQKILLLEDPKYRLQKQLKQIQSKGNEAIYGFKIVAQRGYLTLRQLQIRLCCKFLSQLQYNIIYKSNIKIEDKWKIVCDPNPTIRYQQNLELILAGEKQSQVEDVIVLDVNRSLHLHIDILPHQTLKKFLLYYSRQHPGMPYCQGMNYLAGYILLKTNLHPSAYSIFCTVMSKYFLQIFNNNFEGMKLKLYLFDRLLSIFHPDLSDHFKREMITPQCYVVGWIITAFTSTYQYTLKSVLVDWLWERFVMWGWKQFYKLAMGLMQVNREALLVAGYDRCLQILGEIPKSALLTSSNQESFMKEWGHDLQTMLEVFPISDKLLAKLTEQLKHEYYE